MSVYSCVCVCECVCVGAPPEPLLALMVTHDNNFHLHKLYVAGMQISPHIKKRHCGGLQCVALHFVLETILLFGKFICCHLLLKNIDLNYVNIIIIALQSEYN